MKPNANYKFFNQIEYVLKTYSCEVNEFHIHNRIEFEH